MIRARNVDEYASLNRDAMVEVDEIHKIWRVME